MVDRVKGRKKVADVRETALSHVSLLGVRAKDPIALVDKVASGLPFRAIEEFRKQTGFPSKLVGEWIQVPVRTIARRKSSGKLGPAESDRLVRASRVFGLALDLFEGDRPAARRWLLAPRAALGGRSPFELAKTEVGAREVEAFITRLEHGVHT